MTGPARNRVRDYEAGWLPLLMSIGAATKQEAHDAVCRVAKGGIDEIEEQRMRRQERRNRRQ